MSEIHIDSMSVFDEVEEHSDCTVQILKNSVTGEISVGWTENKRGCKWCEGLLGLFSTVHNQYGRDVTDQVRYCFHCGKQLKTWEDEEDDEYDA